MNIIEKCRVSRGLRRQGFRRYRIHIKLGVTLALTLGGGLSLSRQPYIHTDKFGREWIRMR